MKETVKETVPFIERLALRICEAIGIIVLAAVALYAFDQIKNPLLAVVCSFIPTFLGYLAMCAMGDSVLAKKQNKK